jgi:hypothetical protein
MVYLAQEELRDLKWENDMSSLLNSLNKYTRSLAIGHTLSPESDFGGFSSKIYTIP